MTSWPNTICPRPTHMDVQNSAMRTQFCRHLDGCVLSLDPLVDSTSLGYHFVNLLLISCSTRRCNRAHPLYSSAQWPRALNNEVPLTLPVRLCMSRYSKDSFVFQKQNRGTGYPRLHRSTIVLDYSCYCCKLIRRWQILMCLLVVNKYCTRNMVVGRLFHQVRLNIRPRTLF